MPTGRAPVNDMGKTELSIVLEIHRVVKALLVNTIILYRGNCWLVFNFGLIGGWGRLRKISTPPNNSWVQYWF